MLMQQAARALLVLVLTASACSDGPSGAEQGDGPGDQGPAVPASEVSASTASSPADDFSPPSEPEPAGGTFTAVAAGYWHTCAIRAKGGTVECWGVNDSGVLDAPDGQFKALTAGDRHNCAIRIDGRIECWGHDAGNLRNVPDGSFTAVSAGGDHSCALRDDGDVECWGDGDTESLAPPGGHFAAVATGGSHACVLRTVWVPKTVSWLVRRHFGTR